MKVEILIYAYLAICASMIVFNIVCIFAFRKKDRNTEKRSIAFTNSILSQIKLTKIEESHKKFLMKKLKKINHLMAFDETLENLYSADPEGVQNYIEKLSDVFIYLTLEYRKKSQIQAAYFPYIIKKYGILKGQSISIILDSLIDLVREDDLYCRENALQALYTIGDVDSVINALKILNKDFSYHHPKLITDGLLTFSGDKQSFNRKLWENLNKFSLNLQIAILDYFRFESADHCENMFKVMIDKNKNQELRFRAIRYFAKYHYEPALPYIFDFAEQNTPVWEYKAISASALANYPSPKTGQILKELLSNKNWYIRYNASESLDKLGYDYDELIDIFEGNDRFAGEILRYRFDRKNLNKKEATV